MTAPLSRVHLWSAERPYLYTLCLALVDVATEADADADAEADAEAEAEVEVKEAAEVEVEAEVEAEGGAGACIEWERMKLGARTCQVVNKQLLINNVAVTLKGVNRHEHDPLSGKVI